jgi:hypothetical protein
MQFKGENMKRSNATLAAALGSLILLAPSAGMAQASGSSELPAGTRIYLSLDEGVTSARGSFDVGAIVRCSIWRDVENRGVTFIKGGTPATCRVDKISRRNMGGTEGKLAIGAVETKSEDGQTVILTGGYNKEGSGHKAVVWTVGMLLFWPALFVPGGNAELPPGTVFDASTVNDLTFETNQQATQPRMVNLSSLVGGMSAEFMVDDFLDQPKHEYFRIQLSKDGSVPKKVFIDSVNGKPIPPVAVTLKNMKEDGGNSNGIAEVEAKALIKHFSKGINRFNITYQEDGESHSTEVIMNVQM